MKAVAFFVLAVITFATALPHPEPAYIKYGALRRIPTPRPRRGKARPTHMIEAARLLSTVDIIN